MSEVNPETVEAIVTGWRVIEETLAESGLSGAPAAALSKKIVARLAQEGVLLATADELREN